MASSKNALQSFWERMFQDYTKHVKYLQTQNPTWEQMVELERYRQALLDFRFNGKCSKRREGIRMKEMQEYMESQKTNLKRKLSHGNNTPRVQEQALRSLIPARKLLQLNDRVVRALNFNSSASDRLKELARSRTNPPQCGAKPWKLTSAMRSFEPSERLLSLACHRTPFREPRNPFKVSSSALIYEATPRILRLAELNKKNVNRHQRGPSKPYWFGPTHRIWELAKPRVREDGIYRKTPFKVAEGALRAKASPRVLQLAEPRM
ncbi:uncharacterized protein [Drosophila kikkawai]|uniref:Uncharacterized protein n=1 Tax=Drosophila kikkawai TaxID=30033 RepID=A0A6P4IDW6_DROKI|nr:uncharacterized protein LOC108073554 isoform X1 [Drosophila kikkawai]